MVTNIDSHNKIRIYHIYFNTDLNCAKPLNRGLVFADFCWLENISTQSFLKEPIIIKIGLFKIVYMFTMMQERKFKVYIVQKEGLI